MTPTSHGIHSLIPSAASPGQDAGFGRTLADAATTGQAHRGRVTLELALVADRAGFCQIRCRAHLGLCLGSSRALETVPNVIMRILSEFAPMMQRQAEIPKSRVRRQRAEPCFNNNNILLLLIYYSIQPPLIGPYATVESEKCFGFTRITVVRTVYGFTTMKGNEIIRLNSEHGGYQIELEV